MTQVLIDRATLEQLVHGVEMGFDFDDGDVFGVMSNDMTDALSEGRAALAQQGEQQGWKLVPVEPTDDMLYEIQENCHIMPPRGKRIWAQMLAAAPAPVAQQGAQPTQRQLDTAMRQWETWKAYALELQAKVVKYEGGSPMLLNAAAPAPQT